MFNKKTAKLVFKLGSSEGRTEFLPPAGGFSPTQRHLSWYVRREDSIMSYLGSELILLIACHLPAPHPGLVLLEEVPGDADQKLEWAVPSPSSYPGKCMVISRKQIMVVKCKGALGNSLIEECLKA